jgi:acetyl-CoA synthetase
MARRLDTYHFYEEEWADYDELYEAFEFEIPATFNIAEYVCDRWVEGNSKVALFADDLRGTEQTYTFWQLRRAADRMANFLAAEGIGEGDRIGVTGAQKPETLIAHLAAWKLGAVSVPLSSLFGRTGLRYRIADAGMKAFVVDETAIDTLREVRDDLEDLEHVLPIDGETARDDEVAFWDAVTDHPPERETVDADSEQLASILYTSGTTGDPKGVKLPHQIILGALPSFMCGHCNVQGKGVLWLPAEWSWVAFFAPVVTNLFYGSPVVAYDRDQFEPEKAFELIEKYGINRGMFPPSALRMMMQVEDAEERYDVTSYESMVVGGEEIGETVIDWVDRVFGGTAINAAFGQSEAIMFLGECHALGVEHREGKLGRPYPGYEVAIVDPETAEPTVPTGEVGEIALGAEGNPGIFTGYLDAPEKTAAKRRKGWLLSEDLGVAHEDGYVSFTSRKDDVIISSGYRIGPGEIEDVLVAHDDVVDAGVIGVPDDERGEVPKAFVELVDGATPGPDLEGRLRQHVKTELAKYEYPREVAFVEHLPRTTTGTTQRADLRDREGLDR